MNKNKYPPLSENQKRLQEELGDCFTKWDQPVPHVFVHFNEEYPGVARTIFEDLGPERKSK